MNLECVDAKLPYFACCGHGIMNVCVNISVGERSTTALHVAGLCRSKYF